MTVLMFLQVLLSELVQWMDGRNRGRCMVKQQWRGSGSSCADPNTRRGLVLIVLTHPGTLGQSPQRRLLLIHHRLPRANRCSITEPKVSSIGGRMGFAYVVTALNASDVALRGTCLRTTTEIFVRERLQLHCIRVVIVELSDQCNYSCYKTTT